MTVGYLIILVAALLQMPINSICNEVGRWAKEESYTIALTICVIFQAICPSIIIVIAMRNILAML